MSFIAFFFPRMAIKAGKAIESAFRDPDHSETKNPDGSPKPPGGQQTYPQAQPGYPGAAPTRPPNQPPAQAPAGTYPPGDYDQTYQWEKRERKAARRREKHMRRADKQMRKAGRHHEKGVRRGYYDPAYGGNAAGPPPPPPPPANQPGPAFGGGPAVNAQYGGGPPGPGAPAQYTDYAAPGPAYQDQKGGPGPGTTPYRDEDHSDSSSESSGDDLPPSYDESYRHTAPNSGKGTRG